MKFKNTPLIKTERLTLGKFSEGDCDSMVKMLTDSEIKKTYMIPDFSCREEAVRLFDRFVALSRSEEHFAYGIYLDGTLVGFMNDVEIGDDFVELGYVISTDHKGRGYATEALGAAIEELFETGFERVRAGAFEENPASIRVMEKCGMTRIEQVDFIEYRGTTHRCVYLEKRR